MIDNFKIFNENRIISCGEFIGYKTPFDRNNLVAVIVNENNKHSFINKEFKGVWRLKDPKNGESINLNNKNIKIKIGNKYQFMGINFTPRYSRNSGYYAIISPINNVKSETDDSDKLSSWVIYSDDLPKLLKDIKRNIKLYKKEYNLI